MGVNNSFVSIKIREEDKIYLEDLKMLKKKKLHEVVTEVIEAHRFVESLRVSLGCKDYDEVLQILSELLPNLLIRAFAQRFNRLQSDIQTLYEQGYLDEEVAKEIRNLLGEAVGMYIKNIKTKNTKT